MHLLTTSLVLASALWLTTGALIRAATNVKTEKPQDTTSWAAAACCVWAMFYYLSHS